MVDDEEVDAIVRCDWDPIGSDMEVVARMGLIGPMISGVLHSYVHACISYVIDNSNTTRGLDSLSPDRRVGT